MITSTGIQSNQWAFSDIFIKKAGISDYVFMGHNLKQRQIQHIILLAYKC